MGDENNLRDLSSVISNNLHAPWNRVAAGKLTYIRCDASDSGDVTLSQVESSSHEKAARKLSVLSPRLKCPYKANCTPEEAGFIHPISKLLDQWRATAISGNDLIGSVLYTTGPTTFYAGYYAPLCLLLVVIMLQFFRAIYVEFVTALPLNGGSYSAMLNTTGKRNAVVAACLSYLSYTATVVVSAATAANYLQRFWTNMPTLACTVVIIALFAAIMLFGMRESSILATIIFIIHLLTLILLVIMMLIYAINNGFYDLKDHYTTPGPSNPVKAIVFGFSAGMLGITGFETTANYVQDLRPGTFRLVLRNMWIVVAIINPVVSLLAFAVVPVHELYDDVATLAVNKNFQDAPLQVIAHRITAGPFNVSRPIPDYFSANGSLSNTSYLYNSTIPTEPITEGDYYGGSGWLWKLVVADAVLVLCGGVLTGYVGVNGLLRRMVDDDILPRIFTAQLPVTKASWAIILLFGFICITLILITEGNILSISGVFAVAFVSVMALFCLSNLCLKATLPELKSEQKAKWYITLLCFFCLIIAIVGNCMAAPEIIGFFAIYFTLFMLIFYGLFRRTTLIRLFLELTVTRTWRCLVFFRVSLMRLLNYIELEPVVYFSRRLGLREMNVAIQKVLSEELSRRLVIVHIYEQDRDIPRHIEYNLSVLNKEYPTMCIDIILMQGRFNPGSVRLAECILKIPPNRMFVACPSKEFPYNMAELGSCRIIMSRSDRRERLPADEDEHWGRKPSIMYDLANQEFRQRAISNISGGSGSAFGGGFRGDRASRQIAPAPVIAEPDTLRDQHNRSNTPTSDSAV